MTANRSAAAQKAAVTRKRRVTGQKAAKTKKRRAARREAATRKPNMGEREYQDKVKAKLERFYKGEQIEVQWYPFRGEGLRIYGPIVDVAVGPFATEQRYETRYDELLHKTRVFVERLIEKHNQNVEAEEVEQTSFDAIASFNRNARCLLCIEVEESGTRKHCLGDLVNASALGRIGLLIARSQQVLRIFVRQRVYLRYLANVGKNTFRTDNALVLTAQQFDACLSSD